MNAFNVFMHRQHSVKYFLLIYTVLFTIIAALAIAAETFFIR